MPAEFPTPMSIITTAARKLCAIGAGETQPSAEDTEVFRIELNALLGLLNKRSKTAGYTQNQAFTFTLSQQSYTIGPASSPNPDFIVQQGGRPVRIERAQLVLTDESPDVLLPVAVWNWPEYTQLSVPALSSQWPFGIYYQPSAPFGLIYPYPAFPTNTNNQLKLWWSVQLLTVATADLNTDITFMPEGSEGALASNLAFRAWSMFPKRSDYDAIAKQARRDWAEITSPNQPPPKISTTDGIQPGGSAFSWRSRQWV